MADLPDIIPGLEEFWAPDESLAGIEHEAFDKPPKFAAGREHPNAYGVVYRGSFETLADGVCTAVRRNANALRRTRMPVFLSSPAHMHWNNGMVERSFYHELPPAVLAEVDHLTQIDHRRTVAFIEHFVPTLDYLIGLTTAGPLSGGTETKQAMLKSTAAYVAIDYPVISKEWAYRFNFFGAVMVPCGAAKRALETAGVTVPVVVVPHPLAVRDPMRRAGARYEGGTYRFLHVGKWEPRKLQHRLIGAFLLHFTPDDDVRLTMKCRPFWRSKDYPLLPSQSVAHWSNQMAVKARGWTASTISRAVQVIEEGALTREQLAKLYGQHHAYVQSGRYEGFDLPALDAKVAGHRLVAVAAGGPEDFVGPDDVIVNAADHRAPPEAYQGPEGCTWPDPSIHEFGVALQQAYARRLDVVAKFDDTPYLIDSVGKQIRAVCDRLASLVGVDTTEYRA